MEPRLETELGALYDARALELLEYLSDADETAQLVFADPPYNIGKADWDRFETETEYLDWVVDWVGRAGELVAEDGSLFVMGFSEGLADVKYRLSRECEWYDTVRWLVWSYRNKPQMGDTEFTRSHESLLWLRKSDEYRFRMDRVRIPYNDHTEAYPVRPQGGTSQFGEEAGYEWDPNVDGAKPRDVIDVPTVNNASSERTDHPTQKPEELLRKLVWATTDRGDLILDPFGGSGTTYAVAEQLGRRWIGTDPDPDYRETIERRLEGIDRREDPEYWMQHDLDRREHRRRIRYGSE